MRYIGPKQASAKRILPGLALLAAFAGGSLSIHGQPAPDVTSAATAAGPGFIVTPEDLGDSLLMHRRYQEAIDEYKKARQDSPEVWDRMGIAYQMLSDLKDAARCYRESLRRSSRNEFALNNLGTVYDQMGDFEKAEGLYRKALQVDPRSARIVMNLGTNLMFQNKYREGSDMYRRALALDKDAFDKFGPVTATGAPLRERGAMNYFKAQRCAQAGIDRCAVKYLRMALNEGYASVRKVAADSSFARLRGTPAFERLIAEQSRP